MPADSFSAHTADDLPESICAMVVTKMVASTGPAAAPRPGARGSSGGLTGVIKAGPEHGEPTSKSQMDSPVLVPRADTVSKPQKMIADSSLLKVCVRMQFEQLVGKVYPPGCWGTVF